MKKSLALICAFCLLFAIFATGCTNTNQNIETTAPKAAKVTPVLPDNKGKIPANLLDSEGIYEQYAPDDTDHMYLISRYECKPNGKVITGDVYEYDTNHNETKRVHYEGKILDYTEVREYNELNQNTRIVCYAGTVKRENLVSTCVIEYDKNGNETKSLTYDSDNNLSYYDMTSYILINGGYEIESCSYYESDDTLSEKTVYSYRQDGTLSKDIRTVYNGNEVYYYCQTAYDMNGDMVSCTYFDKNNKEIDEPQEEIDAYGE